MIEIPITLLTTLAFIPTYARFGDAGADLYTPRDLHVPVGGAATIPLGFAMAVPDGYVGLVCPRSGLANRHGITVSNAPGVVDSGYRGEMIVLLTNHGDQPVEFIRGDRIAQLVVVPISWAQFKSVEHLATSERGTGGLGSTGR